MHEPSTPPGFMHCPYCNDTAEAYRDAELPHVVMCARCERAIAVIPEGWPRRESEVRR